VILAGPRLPLAWSAQAGADPAASTRTAAPSSSPAPAAPSPPSSSASP